METKVTHSWRLYNTKPVAFYVTLEGKIPRTPLRRMHELIENKCSEDVDDGESDLRDYIENRELAPLMFDFSTIKPSCRFSSIVLIESLTRRYKAMSFDRNKNDRFLFEFRDFEECVLYEYMGGLFFDFYNSNKMNLGRNYERNKKTEEELGKTLEGISLYRSQYEGDYDAETFFKGKSPGPIKALEEADVDYFKHFNWKNGPLRLKAGEYTPVTQELIDDLMGKLEEEKELVSRAQKKLKTYIKSYENGISELNDRISMAPMAMFGI